MSTAGVCGAVARMFLHGKPDPPGTAAGNAVLRSQRRDCISLYGLSFNLAALERLCRHVVRYFHPPSRFLNG